MKKYLLSFQYLRKGIFFLILGVLSTRIYAQKSVGIGIDKPNPNAVLHLNIENNSLPQGFMLPQVDPVQRSTLGAALGSVNSLAGMMVYDKSDNIIYVWTVGGWAAVGSGTSTQTTITGINGVTVTGAFPNFTIGVTNTNAGINMHAFRAKQITPQNIAGGSAVLLQMDNVDFNTEGDFNTATYRYTPTESGFYWIGGQVRIGGGGESALNASVFKNGVQELSGNINAIGQRAVVGGVVFANGSTDYFDLRIYHAGTTQSIDINETYFYGFKINGSASSVITTTSLVANPTSISGAGGISINKVGDSFTVDGANVSPWTVTGANSIQYGGASFFKGSDPSVTIGNNVPPVNQKQLNLGYNNTGEYAYIESIYQGNYFTNIIIGEALATKIGIGTTTPNEKFTVNGNSSTSGIGYFGSIQGNDLAGLSGSIVTVDGAGRLGRGTLPTFTNQWQDVTSNFINTPSIVGVNTTANPYGDQFLVTGNAKVIGAFEVGDNAPGNVNKQFVMSYNYGVNAGQMVAYEQGVGPKPILLQPDADPNASVGIGITTAPTARLDVNGTIRFRTYNTAGSILTVDGSGNLGLGTLNIISSQWVTSSSDIYYSSGNVGIGSTNTNSRLHIKQSSQVNDVLTDVGSGYYGAGVTFENNGTTDKFYMGYGFGGIFRIGKGTAANVFIPIMTIDDSNVSIIGTLTSNNLKIANLSNGILSVDGLGNVITTSISNSSQWITSSPEKIYTNSFVGIGTSNPAYALSVFSNNNGGVSINTIDAGAGNAVLYFNSTISGPSQINSGVISLKNAPGDRALQFYNSTQGIPSNERIFNFLNNATASIISILNNGNMGIGGVLPNEKLTVQGNISSTGIGYFGALISNNMAGAPVGSIVTVDGAGQLGYGTLNVTSSQWITSSPEKIYTNSFVGIGISNPIRPLHISGIDNLAQIIVNESVGPNNLVISANFVNGLYYPYIGNTLNRPFGLVVNNTHRLFVTTTGSVGIGDSFFNPSEKLDVAGSIGLSGNLEFKGAGTRSIKGNRSATEQFVIEQNAADQMYIALRGRSEVVPGQIRFSSNSSNADPAAGLYLFSMYNGSGHENFMNINKTGNVFIGTDAETERGNEKLTVKGNSSITGIGYFGTLIGNNLSGVAGSIVTVDGAGKLGIGTINVTSSQWITTTNGIYIASSVGINGIEPTPTTALNIKSTGNSSKPIRVENSGGTFPLFEIDQGSGGNSNLMLYNNAGVLVSQISATNPTYFNGGNNVGIGTTTPNQKLFVEGNISATGFGYFTSIQGNDLAGAAGSIVTVDGVGKLGIGSMPTFSNQWQNISSNMILTNSFVGVGGVSNSSSFTVSTTGNAINAGSFTIENTSSFATSLSAATKGQGSALSGFIQNTSNPSSAVVGVTDGVGSAGFFDITNASSNASALKVNTNGVGKAAEFIGSGGVYISSSLSIAGLNGASGSIVTVDGAGKLGLGTIASNNWVNSGANSTHTTGGNVGINISNTTGARFHVGGNNASTSTSGAEEVARIGSNDNTALRLGIWMQTNAIPNNQYMALNAISSGNRSLLLQSTGGNVGIGTILPNEKLFVQGNISATGIGYFGTLIGNNMAGAPVGSVVTVDGAGQLGYGTLNVTSSQWITTTPEKIYTNSFVGIGINNPISPLHIFGGMPIIQRNSDAAGFNAEIEFSDFVNSNTNRWRFGLRPSDQDNLLNIANWDGGNYNYRMFIHPTTGNVGIGSFTSVPPLPTEKLTVFGNSSITGIGYFGTIVGNNMAGAPVGSIVTVDGAGKLGYGNLNITSSQWTNNGADIFYNTGNVGIGTSTPASPLSIFSQSNTNPVSSFLFQGANGAGNAVAGRFVVSATGTAGTSQFSALNTRLEGDHNNGSASSYMRGLRVESSTSGTIRIRGLDVDIQGTGTGNKTGAYINVIGTGAAINTGLDVNVSGATTNYAALFNGGNVGIGTTAPEAELHVVGGAKATSISITGLAGNGTQSLGINNSGQIITLPGTANSWVVTTGGITYNTDKISVGVGTVAGAAKFKVDGDGSMGGMVLVSQGLPNPISTMNNAAYEILLSVPVFIPVGTNRLRANYIAHHSNATAGTLRLRFDGTQIGGTVSTIGTTPAKLGGISGIDVASLAGTWVMVQVEGQSGAAAEQVILSGFSVVVQD
ncbi:MAG: hypothetical protein NW207_11080 [Cytophagales bacterium]|nr:hypothetical protein [Cytophagales bacterium]